MTSYTAINYITSLITIIGQTFTTFFSMPLFHYENIAVTLGSVLLFDFIITIILTFALNLPTRGIESWTKEK